MDIRYSLKAGCLELRAGGRRLLYHSPAQPLIRLGSGEGHFSMYRGNFEISERLDELIGLRDVELVSEPISNPHPGNSGSAITPAAQGLLPDAPSPRPDADGHSLILRFSRNGLSPVTVSFSLSAGRLVARLSRPDSSEACNRFVLCLPADPAEHIYGCGEQFSHFDLRGKKVPLWTSEQGVGRNKSTPITFEADRRDRCGGDWWWTFYPQPSFASSSGLWCHLDTSAYAEFDFTAPDCHRLYAWALPESLVLGLAGLPEARSCASDLPDMTALVSDMTAYFGRQPLLPDWVHDGVILGIQGGPEICKAKAEAAREAGVPVVGIWAQDWEGINITSFGQRLRWNWVWNPERYPGLDREIHSLRKEGLRFLGYINCYVGAGWSLFNEAQAAGYLAKNAAGDDYLVDFGEFDAGIVDFTNPEAFTWYKNAIKKHLIDFGLAGWMADFGEYLPTDARLHSGLDAELAHNLWPALWARCVHEAVAEAGAENEIFWFMRAGFTGSQRWCPSMWAGDQNVDWSEDDGLPSVVTAALALAMSGHGLHHSDIGGYTTLYGMKRSKELFMRWAEQAAFSTAMRSHEGNRPRDNWQFDSDAETLAHLASMVRLHVALKPYLLDAERENSQRGIPVMRPLFFGHEAEEAVWAIQDEYFFGPDLLVAPVMTEGATSRRFYLPSGRWIDLWTGIEVEQPGRASRSTTPSTESGSAAPGVPVTPRAGSWIEVQAPLGRPPVFYRAGSSYEMLFREAVRQATLEV